MYRQEYIPPIQPGSPSWRQRGGREVQQTENAPSVMIKVEYDKKNPNTQKIMPTRESVRALAEWYKTNGFRSDTRVSISGPEIGSKELPPLFSQWQNFDERNFQKWATEVMGAGVITEMPEPELPILRKIYGNLWVIEAMRQEKYETDIKKWTVKNLWKMKLDAMAKEILDEKLGDPLEFKEDIEIVNAMIADEKEYGYLTEEAIDYIFGCILNAHTFGKGKKLVLEGNQPVVKTGNTNEDLRWKWVLDTLHFWIKLNSPITARDNQSKIADYIAAYTYHNTDKNLVWHYSTLAQKVLGTNTDVNLTQDKIEKSSLSASEKSFLSQWLGQEWRLWNIQEEQREYVERARENTKWKSFETIKRDFIRAPLTTISQLSPVTGLALGAGIIWGLVRLFVGEGKTSKFFWVIAAILGWVAIVGNIKTAEKLWWEVSGKEMGNIVTQAPRRTVDTGDALTEEWREFSAGFSEEWDRFSASFTTSNDWRGLILDKRVWPKLVKKYPTGTILSVLNPDPNNKYNEHGKWRGTTAQEKEIKEILEKLEPAEKETLNTMLQETWNKYKEGQWTSLTHEGLKNGTIKDMIDSIDVTYGWYSKLWRPAYWANESEKTTALTEFTKRPKKWKDTKIGDLMVGWFSGSRTDLPTGWTVQSKTTNLIWTIPAGKLDAMKNIITKIWEDNAPCNPETTLGGLLAKES